MTSSSASSADSTNQFVSTTSPRPAPVDSKRVVAVDIGRGYAMALLITIPFLLQVFRAMPDSIVAQEMYRQLTHSKWHGATYIDTGLPAFIFVVGMSITIVLGKTMDAGRVTRHTYIKIGRRAIILFLIGILANGGFSRPWPEIRIAGVLQRIAICYLAGSFVVLYFRPAGRIVVFLALLFGYWAVLALVPVPGYGAANWSLEGNVAAYVDQQWLPGRPLFREAHWDSEGIVSTIGAIATCIIGIIVASVYRGDRWTPKSRTWFFFLTGAGFMILGYQWSYWLPFNKAMWTPPFILFCAGQCMITMGIINQITDVWRKNWLFPFVVIGQNSLIAYLAVGILPFENVAERLVGGDIQQLLGVAGPVVFAGVQVVLCWLLLYWLYRNGLTMKI